MTVAGIKEKSKEYIRKQKDGEDSTGRKEQTLIGRGAKKKDGVLPIRRMGPRRQMGARCRCFPRRRRRITSKRMEEGGGAERMAIQGQPSQSSLSDNESAVRKGMTTHGVEDNDASENNWRQQNEHDSIKLNDTRADKTKTCR